MPTVSELLRVGRRALAAHGLEAPHVDVEFLLARLLGVTVSDLRLRGHAPVPDPVVARFDDLVADRARGRPLAYILGEWEFYGLELSVDSSVLVPRPETELLVDWVRALFQPDVPVRIADVGTGSGCIAVALAHHLPRAEVHATDVSDDALTVARANAARHDLTHRIEFHRGDLLSPLKGRFDCIVSNPPYVAPNDPRLDANVRDFEPALALYDHHDGDGLGFYRRFAREFEPYLADGGFLLLEVGEQDAQSVIDFFVAHGCHGRSRRDLAGIERAVLVERRRHDESSPGRS